jgi:hypothetical protein
MHEGLTKFGVSPEEKPFGGGMERDVYRHATDKRKVIAVERKEVYERSARGARGEYYLTKIMHILLPQHIPDIHLYASKPSAAVRQKVEMGAAHEQVRDAVIDRKRVEEGIKLSRAYKESLKSDSRVHDLLRAIKGLGIGVDSYSMNHFGFDQNGNVKYVETFPAFSGERILFNKEVLQRAIANIRSGKDRVKALTYLERLAILAKEPEAHDQ